MLWDAPIGKICIENPIGVLSTQLRKPDQIIHPYYFGENVKKSTCLWLKNLPLLERTNHEPHEEKYKYFPSGKRMSWWNYEMSKLNGEKRRHERSKTFQCIADAMAEQWG